MPELNNRKQTRLTDYDYAENGHYFVTMCSNNRQNIFVECSNTVGAGLASARQLEDASIFNNDSASGNNFKLSPVGKIIQKQWNDIPNHHKGIELDAYVIMPNHVHGIIIINQKNKRADARPAPTLSDIICSFKSRSAVESLQYIKKTTPAASRQI